MKHVSLMQTFAASLILAACSVSGTASSPRSLGTLDGAALPASDQPGVDDVKRFVNLWFSLFDRRAAAVEVSALVTNDIHADFMGQVVSSRQAFATMYEGSITTQKSIQHDLTNILVSPERGGASVQTWVRFRAASEQGERVDVNVQQTWHLIWRGGTEFQIDQYIVRPALSEAESKRLQNRAQAVLYRWFYFYETTQPNFAEQYAILADDVMIEGTVPVRSLAEYKKSLETPYFVFGQNAHHVESIAFTSVTPASTTLAVAILYQGIDKEGVTHSYRLQYAIEMVEAGSSLPKIKAMKITPVAPAEPIFIPAYADNVAKARACEQAAIH